MRSSRLLSISLVAGIVAGATIIACGGGGGKNPDAKVFMDSKVFMDGGSLAGLGKKCGSAGDCPANAKDCIGFSAGKLFCSPPCDTNATGTTGSNGQFPNTGAGALNPAPSNTPCTAAYTATVGVPVCAAIVATTPNDNPLKPNTQYIPVQLDCAVGCGTGMACPPGMTCNTAIGGACEPN